jgi:hypothetical protein
MPQIVQRSGNGGGWINNGLGDPSLSGIDPKYPLSSPQGMAEDKGLLVDEETLITARYLVECALPLGSNIVKLVDGEPLVLHGHVGLTPEWQDGACDVDCRQWISACMLARTNVSTRHISIWLRADHPALPAGSPAYPIYEGSFFGDLFADPETRYVCQGSEPAAVIAQQSGRTCSSDPDACELEAYDDCEEAERCELVDDEGVFAIDCTPAGTTLTHRTISVYLANPGAGGNESCGGNGHCNES